MYYYHQAYVDEKELIFLQEVRSPNESPEKKIEFCVIAHRVLAESKPWLQGFSG